MVRLFDEERHDLLPKAQRAEALEKELAELRIEYELVSKMQKEDWSSYLERQALLEECRVEKQKALTEYRDLERKAASDKAESENLLSENAKLQEHISTLEAASKKKKEEAASKKKSKFGSMFS